MSKNVILNFSDGSEIELPVNELVSTNEGNGAVKHSFSTSNIIPANDMVLIAAYGLTDLLALLNNPDKVSLKSKFKIVGTGATVDYEKFDVNIGDQVMFRSHDEYQLFKAIDVDNKLSVEALIELGKNDRELLAATAITREKDRSKLGLNMVRDVQITDATMELIKANEQKKVGSNLLYKGKKVPFINYYLTHPSNIIAIIQTPNNVTDDNTAT